MICYVEGFIDVMKRFSGVFLRPPSLNMWAPTIPLLVLQMQWEFKDMRHQLPEDRKMELLRVLSCPDIGRGVKVSFSGNK